MGYTTVVDEMSAFEVEKKINCILNNSEYYISYMSDLNSDLPITAGYYWSFWESTDREWVAEIIDINSDEGYVQYATVLAEARARCWLKWKLQDKPQWRQ